ncbi:MULTISPECIES: alpha/beta hydrolase [unclassified Streptomyces]|uniref:alpha/beta fold hydrolase n=1 Tax=unclassified Streptomyces TaxID=2593676 RepID=UPI003318771A
MTRPYTQGGSVWVPTRDGRRLHAMVLDVREPDAGPPPPGRPPPTVVFEAGVAADRSSWARVQPAVARFARAVVYDRAGLGRSAPDPAGRTLTRMADDLGDLLDHFGPGPFVLVGHSAGGPIVRRAAADRPDRITGLVLVEPTDEGADVLFTPGFRRMSRIVPRAYRLLARLDLLHLLHKPLLRAVPEDVRAAMRREAFTAGAMSAWAETNRTFLDELAAWRDTPPDTGDIALTVVSGARAGNGMSRSIRAAANASHARRAAGSAGGRHVIAERSGHYVPLTEPDLVVAQIARLVRQPDAPEPKTPVRDDRNG